MDLPLSIVVCTYNRAALLDGCLQSLISQTCAPDVYEVIVVDNNSNDNTHEVVEAFRRQANLSYFVETRQGLSLARNLGLGQSKGDFVAYLDDDVLVPQDWVENAIGLIRAHQPKLDGLGGPLFPFYTTPKPGWYEDEYSIQMGARQETYFLNPGKSFIGANMVWQKGLLLEIGGFKPEFGYVGGTQTLGEETDAFHRAWLTKPDARFLFSPALWVKHWVPPEKMTLAFRVNRQFKNGLTNYHIRKPYLSTSRVVLFARSAGTLIKIFAKCALAIPRYRHWQKWAYCEFALVASAWGEVRATLGMRMPAGER